MPRKKMRKLPRFPRQKTFKPTKTTRFGTPSKDSKGQIVVTVWKKGQKKR